VAAMIGMLSIAAFAIGIELAKYGYFAGGSRWFSAINLLAGLIWLALVRGFLRERQRRSQVVAL